MIWPGSMDLKSYLYYYLGRRDCTQLNDQYDVSIFLLTILVEMLTISCQC